MQVGIFSLQKTLFTGEAVSLNCKTENGEITVLNHHRPLVSALVKGVITVTDTASKEHFIPVSSGFLEMTSLNEAKLIVEE